jgi:hypothetical protein
MADDVIPMSMTCSNCGVTVTNDMPEIQHPLEFMQALRLRGWKCDEGKPPRCDKCQTSSSA